MPVYNFVCQNETCEHEFEEVYFSWNDDTSDQKCPKCNSQSQKVPSMNARMKANWSLWNSLSN